jgi:Fe2+ transport system protein B
LFLELPPYRFPTIKQMWLRAWQETQHFLRFAWRFIVVGVVLVWLIYGVNQETGLAGAIAKDIDWVQAYSFMLCTLPLHCGGNQVGI